MGKSFSCLSCKTDDNSRGKCGRKRQLPPQPCDNTGPKHEMNTGPKHAVNTGTKHELNTGPKHKVNTGPKHAQNTGPTHVVNTGPKHEAKTCDSIESKHEVNANPIHELDAELRAKGGDGIWKLEDVDDSRLGPAVTPITARHGSSVTTEEAIEAECLDVVTGRLDAVVTVLADVNVNVSYQNTPTHERRRSSPSPGMHFKKSESIPVSLRQANEEYTQRMRKHRQMTTDLARRRNTPSPLRATRQYTEPTKDNNKVDIGYSQVRATRHDTEPIKDNDKVDIGYSQGDFTQHSVDKTCNVELTKDIVVGDKADKKPENLLEYAFFKEFPINDVQFTPVPSVLDVRKLDKLADDTKDNSLTTDDPRRQEEAFFQESPVGGIDLTPVPSFLDVTKVDKSTGDMKDMTNTETSHQLEDTLVQDFPVKDAEFNPVQNDLKVHVEENECTPSVDSDNDLTDDMVMLTADKQYEDTDAEFTSVQNYLKVHTEDNECTPSVDNVNDLTDGMVMRTADKTYDDVDTSSRHTDHELNGKDNHRVVIKDEFLNLEMVTCASNDATLNTDNIYSYSIEDGTGSQPDGGQCGYDRLVITEDDIEEAESESSQPDGGQCGYDRLIITEEDIEEAETRSSDDESDSADSSDEMFDQIEETIKLYGESDESDETIAMLRLAQSIMENHKPSEKQRKRLMRNHKRHCIITTCIAENEVGEEEAEITDFCIGMIEFCLDQINFDSDVSRWRQQDNNDVIHFGDSLGEEKVRIDVPDCYHKHQCNSPVTTNIINSIGYISGNDTCVDADDRLKDIGTIITDDSKRVYMRRIPDDRDVIIAVDSNGMGHPYIRGSYTIAIDGDGMGYPILLNKTTGH